MTWSYVICNLVGRALKIKVPTYLALSMGAIPDFDIYFLGLGVAHHTFTHSIIIWVRLPDRVCRSRQAVAAIFSRSGPAFSNRRFLGGNSSAPPSNYRGEFGLNLGVQGRNEVILEVGTLLLAALMAVRSGDFRSAISVDRRNLLMIIPLIVLVSLTVLVANENHMHFLEYGFASNSITLISISHILLACFLAFSMLQGICSQYIKNRRHR